ncbi:MAG TPA: hypothetical protein VL307_16440 [Chitinophagaceae bacterium]|jgi:hypothetical protein|nr:hypothetical protein [Chitinophagaceae bacterium]
MKNRIVTLLAILLLSTQFGFAQDDQPAPPPQKGFDKSKLFIGGNFGLSFSSYYTLINVSPQLGYRFNDYLAAGAGVNFIYSSQKNYVNNTDYSRTNYGVTGLNIFGRVYPIRQILLQLQPEMNYTWGKQKYYYSGTDIPDYKFKGKLVPSLLAGAGGAIPTGGAGAFIIMVQYDLLQNARSPYDNRPFYSFGYNVGF